MPRRARHLLLFVLVVFTQVACGALYGPADAQDSEPVRFTVPKGATAGGLGGALEVAGLIKGAALWKVYLKTSGDGACLKAGDFWLRPDMDLPTLMDTLCGVPIPDDVPFTVVEGWRIRDIDAALAQAGLIKAGAYTEAAGQPSRFQYPFSWPGRDLEGLLFPETYMVSPDPFSVDTLIQRQLTTFSERFWRPYHQALGQRTLHDVVVVASMLEREEPTPANRPTVAGILWKRLDGGWQLGVDATSRYTLADWNDRRAFIRNLKDPDEPYNTRLRRGLPPGPIGNPSVPSLQAALEPVQSEYWYYLHDAQQQVHFARNGREHEKNRARYGVY